MNANKNIVSFVGWARFFAHVLTCRSAWAKKRAHPTVTTKEVAFYLRVIANNKFHRLDMQSHLVCLLTTQVKAVVTKGS